MKMLELYKCLTSCNLLYLYFNF